MSKELYELIALGARYAFAALMLLIVVRAWRITIVDSRRAGTLRRMSPETGISGELVVLDGDEKARRGMRYPVIREGMIGTSRRSDIRIRHSSVRRRHAYFQLTPDGLKLRAHASAPVRDSAGRPVREVVLPDGGIVFIGRVRLLLVLTAASESAPHRAHGHSDRRERRDGEYDDPLFDTDRMFREQPVLRHEPDPRPMRPNDDDALFDLDDEDGSW